MRHFFEIRLLLMKSATLKRVNSLARKQFTFCTQEMLRLRPFQFLHGSWKKSHEMCLPVKRSARHSLRGGINNNNNIKLILEVAQKFTEGVTKKSLQTLRITKYFPFSCMQFSPDRVQFEITRRLHDS